MGRLTIPAVLTVAVVGTAVGLSCGGGGGNPEPDAGCSVYCYDIDGIDASPSDRDAGACGQIVCAPEQCPSGCEPLV